MVRIGYNRAGRVFTASLLIFTVYTLTGIFRGLPVIEVQLPIVLFSYILLLSSASNSNRTFATNNLIVYSLVILLFGYFFIYFQANMETASLQNRIGANYTIFVSFIPVLYAVSGGFDDIDKQRMLRIVYMVTFLTCITTIIGTFQFESPCRELATPDNVEIDRLYKSRNIGGYGFVYFIVLLAPLVLKDLREHFSIPKLVLFLTIAFCVLRSEYTTALLLFILSMAIAAIIWSKSKIFKILIIAGIVVILVNFQSILLWMISGLSESSYTLSNRLDSVSQFRQFGAVGDAENRQDLYLLSINSFLANPFFGNLFSFEGRVGEHSEILDLLGNAGLFGFSILLIIMYSLKKKTPIRQIPFRNPFIKLLYVVAFVIALLNTFLTPELYYAILIVPLLLKE